MSEALYTAASLRAQTAAILQSWGMRVELAQDTADLMVQTDLLGVDSHGVSMLLQYETMLRNGALNPAAAPRVLRDTPSTAVLDGGANLGHVASSLAMKMAIGKARVTGIALVGVRNSQHFGAAGLYARMAVREGLIGLVTSSAVNSMLVPTRGADAVLGTNPIAFAAPALHHAPFVLDMATTTAAANKVKVKALRNQPVPVGWVVDGEGVAVTDPHVAKTQVYDRADGGLTPLGGSEVLGSHKGYGLSLLAQLLGATLVGGGFGPLQRAEHGTKAPPNVGHSFIAIDPSFFGEPQAFEHELDRIIDTLHATRPVDPARPVLVAGEPEEASVAQRSRAGIPLPDSLVQQIRDVAARAGVAFALEVAARGSRPVDTLSATA